MPHDEQRSGWPSASKSVIPYRALPPGPAAAQAARARRVLVACALTVTAGVAGLMVLIYPGGDDGPDPVAEQATDPSRPDWVPSAPVSVLPAPTSEFTQTPTEAAVTLPVRTRRPAPPAVTRTRSPAPAPVVDLNIGATVSLVLADRPEYRLRHRNFIGRVDRIDSRSSALERADSQFVVRKGLGRDGCVSLESVNYPGYFLRHRDFILRLERRDSGWGRRGSSPLFDQDATFCTEPTSDGGAFTLESINYPDRALAVHDDGVIHLDQSRATAFVVRSPL